MTAPKEPTMPSIYPSGYDDYLGGVPRAPIVPAMTEDPRPGDHVETGVREENAMGDERLTVEEVGEIDGRPGILLRGSQEAVKRAAALFGEQVAIVPDGPGGVGLSANPAWRAMTSRLRTALMDGKGAEAALRAAITPGDTNG